MKSALCSLLLAAFAVSTRAQTPDRLHDPVDHYSLQANTFIDALLQISDRFQLPLGVEWIKSADTLKPVQFSKAHTTAAEIFQEVVSAHAGYEWNMENGVVHVFDHALQADPHNPLNTKFEYGLSNDCHPMIAVAIEIHLEQRLRSIVEPKPRGGWGASISSGPNEPLLYVPCRNASVSDFLDALVVVSRQHIWVATFPEKRTVNPAGFLEEMPMKPAGPEQPFWILLPWGAGPPGAMIH